ncbi:MAG TPA: hypothetical protein VJC03_06050, partial [bacterium]|nr:hypothetical protein [bacterium]
YRFNLSNLEKILFFTKNATLYTEYRKNTKLTLDIEEELSYLKKADLRFNLFTTYQMSLTTSRDKNAKYDLRSFLTTSRGNRDSYGLVLKFPPAPKWNLSLNLNTSLSKSYNAQDTLTAHENFYQVRTQLFSDFFTWDKPLHLPFSKKPIKMAQQMKLTCDLDTQFKRSKLNVVTTNFNLYKLDFSSDFNISRNFRWTLGGGLSYQDYIKKRANSYFAFQINTKLQIIF